jgi:signal transduction histidine kinase
MLDRVIGTLALGDRAGRRYTEEELVLLEALADQGALALANAQLHARLREQVHAFHQLAQTATAAAQAKEDFLVSVSHELGTPLTAIKAYVDTLEANPEIDRWLRAEFLGVLKREVDRLARLIGNILDASRLELGRFAVDATDLDLHTVVGDVVRTVATRRLVRYETCGPLPVKGDADRLKQVLLNLVDNALRHGPPDEPVVVRAAVERGCAVLRVCDRGPGVAAEHVGELFQKFQPLGRPGVDQRSATGLGLYLSNEIVKAHGGVLRVEQHQGWGGVFAVELPLREEAR